MPGQPDIQFCTLIIQYVFLIYHHIKKKAVLLKMSFSLGAFETLRKCWFFFSFFSSLSRLEQVSASLKMTEVSLRTRMMLAEICTSKIWPSNLHLVISFIFTVMIVTNSFSYSPLFFYKCFDTVLPDLSWISVQWVLRNWRGQKIIFPHFTEQYDTSSYLNRATWLQG